MKSCPQAASHPPYTPTLAYEMPSLPCGLLRDALELHATTVAVTAATAARAAFAATAAAHAAATAAAATATVSARADDILQRGVVQLLDQNLVGSLGFGSLVFLHSLPPSHCFIVFPVRDKLDWPVWSGSLSD